MDDIFGFFCGTVPILILLHKHGPGPGPWPWFTFIAGGLGGILGLMLFGPKLAADGALLPMFLIAVAGGAFLGQVAYLTKGMIGPNRT